MSNTGVEIYLTSYQASNPLKTEKKIASESYRTGSASVQVSYKDFSKHYESTGWLGRKVVAIPAAMISGTVKVVYHTVVVMLKVITLRGTLSIKLEIYKIGRDFQETFGRLIGLISDQYGLYHLQESRFHKNLYDQIIERSSKLSNFEKEYPIKFYSDQYSTANKFERLSEKSFKRIVPKFTLGHFALVSSTHINDLNWDTIKENQVRALFPIGTSEYSTEAKGSYDKMKGVTSDTFHKVFPFLDKDLLPLTPDEHLNLINFDNLSNKQINAIFCSKHYKSSRKEQLGKLTKENFLKVYSKLDDFEYSDFPEAHFDSIDHKNTTKQQLKQLLGIVHGCSSWEYSTVRNKVAKFGKDNFLHLLKHFSEDDYVLIPSSHLKYLENVTLNKRQVHKMFPMSWSSDIKESKKKLEDSSATFVKKCADLWDDSYFTLVPKKFYNNLDYDKMTHSKISSLFGFNGYFWEHDSILKKLETLTKTNFEKILPKLKDTDYTYIPPSHVKFVKVETLTKNQLKYLFETGNGRLSKSKEKFNTLTIKQMLAIIDHFSFDQLALFDSSHLNAGTSDSNELLKKWNDIFNAGGPKPKPSSSSGGTTDSGSSSGSTGGSSGYKSSESWWDTGSSGTSTSKTNPSSEPVRIRQRRLECYQTLGLTTVGNERIKFEDVKKAFRKLAIQGHPDKVQKLPNETEESYQARKAPVDDRFKDINRAYTDLDLIYAGDYSKI